MAQMAHLPPQQQASLLAQMMAQQQQMQRQMAVLSQQATVTRPPPPPRPAPTDLQLTARVSERMSGAELQLIIRHQTVAVQMNDVVGDDFYHHFWMMKGGQSKASTQPLASQPAVVSTERKPNEQIGQSLGAATVASRTPMASVRAPKPLIVLQDEQPQEGDEGAEPSAPQTTAGPTAEEPLTAALATSEPSTPLAAERWQIRQQIDVARHTLIELRVHASSAAVMTPEGQQLRHSLLQRLFHGVHVNGEAGGGGPRISTALLHTAKGQKLLADLMPLWPAPFTYTVLQAFADSLAICPSHPSAHISSFSKSMAAAPKLLPLEQVLTLLRTLTEHGAAVLKQALLRPELTALLLGLLCHQHVSQQPELAEFYVLLLPLGCTCEPIWTLLHAVLPSVTAGHRALLREATGLLQTTPAMNDVCRRQMQQFTEQLNQAA